MPMQYNFDELETLRAQAIRSTLAAARLVAFSRFITIENGLWNNGIRNIVFFINPPPGWRGTRKAFQSNRGDPPFDDTLYILDHQSRKMMAAGGNELDAGLGAIHEMAHWQRGRPPYEDREGERLAVEDHMGVARQLGIPDSRSAPARTLPQI